MTSALHRRRIDAVMEVLGAAGARSVIDLGCGEGDLMLALAAMPRMSRVLGIDISAEAVAKARRRLAKARPAAEVSLLQGSLMEPVAVCRGFDVAVLLEVIEHIDPERLDAVERAVFGFMRPAMVIVTTPNRAYNPLLGVPPRRFRHPGHRFEWDRERFQAWGDGVARRHSLAVHYRDIPPGLPRLGGPTQMAVFETVTSEARGTKLDGDDGAGRRSPTFRRGGRLKKGGSSRQFSVNESPVSARNL